MPSQKAIQALIELRRKQQRQRKQRLRNEQEESNQHQDGKRQIVERVIQVMYFGQRL